MAAKFTLSQMQSALLGDEFAQRVLADIHYRSYPESVQAQILSDIGELLLMRLSLEIVKRLPREAGDTFEELIGSGDMEKIRELVEPHIPNLDQFIQDTISSEYEHIRIKLLEASDEGSTKRKPFSYV